MTSQSNLSDLKDASAPSVRLERLPTNTTANAHPVHRWFNFIAGFSPELVRACVGMGKSAVGSNVCLLDPFSGCGTAPLAARMLGASAVAYEPHPFFAAISEAKANSPLYWPDLPRIHATLARGILRRDFHGLTVSDSASAFLGKMFQREDLIALYSARRELAESGLGNNPLAVLILSRILDHCCFAATDGIYKAPTTAKRTISPKAALDRVINVISEDHLEAQMARGTIRIYERSSEEMAELDDESVDLVVTSEPGRRNGSEQILTRFRCSSIFQESSAKRL